MKLKRIGPGRKVNLELFNELIDAINRNTLEPGEGFTTSFGQGGTRIGFAPANDLSDQPAFAVSVVNKDPDDTEIPAGGLCGVIDGLPVKDEEFVRAAALNVQMPKARHAGNFLIAANNIKPGMVGRAYLSGCCYCKVVRWWNSDMLDTVDVIKGQTYGIVMAGGSLDILWEQRNADGTHIIDTEHWAIVRFNGRRFITYKNTGSDTIGLGDPVVPDIDATDDTGLDDELVAPAEYQIAKMASPQGTTLRDNISFVNIGGDVAAGDVGRCFLPIDRAGLIRTEFVYDSSNIVGPLNGHGKFFDGGTGQRVLARLPDHSGSHYAIATFSPSTPNVHMTIRITGGNTLVSGQLGIINLVSELTEVASLWDPDDPGTKEDGIGTGVLYVDGVNRGNVLVVNDGRAGIAESLVETWRVLAVSTVTLPLTGDPTQSVVCYIPSGA